MCAALATPGMPPSTPPAKAAPAFVQVNGEMVEFTKAGNVSRMRAHRGNRPAIPQTHLCTLCPAKFTRITHLHRHLRTHTNERTYKCEKCHTQFTRSDLLTRHKRSCGDPASVNRSRRKSCQACADGKTKCDLQQPCARCKARDRECVYVRSPVAKPRRATVDAPQPQSQSQAGPSSSSSRKPRRSSVAGTPPAPAHPRIPAIAGPSASTPHLDAVPPSSSAPELYHAHAHAAPGVPADLGFSALHAFAPSRTFHDFRAPREDEDEALSSYASSVFSDATENMEMGIGAYGYGAGAGASSSSFAQDALEVNNQLNALFSTELFDKFFRDSLDASLAQSADAAGTGVGAEEAGALDGGQFPFATDVREMQPFMASLPPPDLALGLYALPHEFMAAAHISNVPAHVSHEPTSPALPVPSPAVEPALIPYPSEFQQYIHLFYNMFLAQMPIMHLGTFTVDGKPPILISAMQACGALYVRTHAAAAFMDTALASAREQLVSEFAKVPTRWEDQVHLILAVVLLQTIGLFHQRPDQRAHSSIYHGMLVTMIRQSGLIERVSKWVPPNVHDEVSWREWACHETTKRALLLSYLHDCCHCIYFTLRPTFLRDEVTVPLPCEEALWRAGSWQEWRMVLARPSAYGAQRARFCPPGLQAALATLSAPLPPLDPVPSAIHPSHTPSTPIPISIPNINISAVPIPGAADPDADAPLTVTPFAHFVLAHAILRTLFEDCLARRPLPPHAEGLAVQLMLHNWLQSWRRSPETPDYARGEPLFLHDALPFYWIAQVTLLAYQEDLPPFAAAGAGGAAAGGEGGTGAGGGAGGGGAALGEAKFRLIKEWLRHIRIFLCRGQEGPTLFWDELTKIRMKGRTHSGDASDAGSVGAGTDSSQGLLGFFSGEA